MAKQVTAKCNWVFGEISPRTLGRFDPNKPIFPNSAAILENFLITQAGAIQFWPGTRFIVAAKNAADKIRLERFQYSTSLQYVLEIGDLYIRFLSVVAGVVGQVESSPGVPSVVVTPYALADVFGLQMANKADVMYIVHPSYYPQKLIRTSATTFTIGNVPFVRGPFLDDNVTTTTITPSAATGAGITLTASSAIFLAGHVGSLWRVNSSATVGAVVKITAFTNTTHVTGDIQAEPDGTAGNIGGTSAYADWAEGAFSVVRGYPAALTFFEGRLLYAGTTYEPQKWYASVVGAYDNFNKGAATDADAYAYEISSNIVNAIRWMEADSGLKLGTSGGTITANSPSATGTTPSNPPLIVIDSDYAVMATQPERIGGQLYFIQSNTNQVRQLVFDLITNKDKSEDMTVIADHILRDGLGGSEIARQQSPNDRLWIPRVDGQMAVFTRNVEQAVMGWSRRIAGSTAMGPGLYESVCVLPQEGTDDLVFVSVKRNINGTVKRYLEYFTPELFLNDWDPVRVDCSLTFDTAKTITAITNASPGVITSVGHGFSTNDQVKIDNVVGMTQLNFQHYLLVKLTNDTFSLKTLSGVAINTSAYGKYLSGGQVRKMVTALSGLSHLEGEVVTVQTDAGLPAETQTFTVASGAITLPEPAAVVHVGLPYIGKVQFLPLGGADTQGRSRKVFNVTLRVWKSSGGKFGKDVNNTNKIIYSNQTAEVNPPPASILFTGDVVEVDFESEYAKDWQPVIVQDKPLPLMILAAILTEDVQMDK